ncbi:discoidin domain-containing protein [Methanoculleus sp.]|uniref:discoidin domain-containing protein n=1 Tax=Methanoculleus sp. TaxID=90427 RepID=UPI0025DBF4A0|nr:discoidin domain-containing protein [Methanoculleus sp.]MCK9319819.1 discoidin domain-containing protein [Methanoculleus sp.]
MKQLITYYPQNESDSSVTITATTENANFPKKNLKSLQPVKCWKSTAVNAEQTIKYDLGGLKSFNGIFINRINFAEFYIETSPNNSTWTVAEHVTGLTTDEIADELYMHRFVEITAVNYRYVRLRIPAQTPLFEPTYFKVGNMLIGNFVTIWNPKAGFSVNEIPKLSILEFPRSGYMSVEKIGKTRRVFSGNLDKFTKIEYDKIVKTYQPFVLYLEFDTNKTSVYLVRANSGYARDYFLGNVLNMSFQFDEIV